MTPLNTDSELLRAAQLQQSPIVRVLAQRLADRGTQAAACRLMLAHIARHVDAGNLSKARELIDQTRAALEWSKHIPNHNEAK
jgi:hypothetical protein